MQPRRCAGHSKRTGDPCKNPPMRGSMVCRMHGGQAPQTKAAAQRRIARQRVERQAARLLARSGVDEDPIAHLLDELYRSAAVVQVLGSLVADLDHTEQGIDRAEEPARTSGLLAARPGPGETIYAVVHPLVVLWNEERERRARLARMAIEAGVAERQLVLAEQQADLMVRVINAGLADPALGLDARAQRAAREVFARHLRLLGRASVGAATGADGGASGGAGGGAGGGAA